MNRFAVIDTETTWYDDVMSIGIVIADSCSFESINARYYILTPYKNHGGMYSNSLYANGLKADLECTREKACEEIRNFLSVNEIEKIFAYNAAFDYRHMKELSYLSWHDIMSLAIYSQHNSKIPKNSLCYKTGRLKSGYSMENIYRLLSDEWHYFETHNAIFDAVDELRIMKLLGHNINKYPKLKQRTY